MRTLLSVIALASISMPAFAIDVPEPDSLALLGIGAVALLLVRRKKQ